LKSHPALGSYLVRMTILFACLVIWEGAARGGRHQLFPPPSRVGPTLYAGLAGGGLIWDCIISLCRVAVGYLAGCILAIPLGMAAGRIRAVEHSLGTLIQLFRPLPPLVLSIFVVLWLGFGETAKYLIVGFGVFFPVYIAAFNGMRGVDVQLAWVAASLGASRGRIFLTVLLPGSMRQILTGMRIAIASGFTCLVGAEVSGASSGIVYRIEMAQLAYSIDGMIAGLVCLGILGASVDFLFVWFVGWLAPWYGRS
jgi:NitT/TauT family transport system permease protein